MMVYLGKRHECAIGKNGGGKYVRLDELIQGDELRGKYQNVRVSGLRVVKEKMAGGVSQGMSVFYGECNRRLVAVNALDVIVHEYFRTSSWLEVYFRSQLEVWRGGDEFEF